MGKSKKNKNKFSAAFNKPQPKAEIPVEESAKRTKRIIIIFVSAFLAAALLFGIVLASVMLAKNASYAVKLDNVGITEGVANYFVTEFKAEYIKKLNSAGVIASDTAAFWNSPYINSTVSTSTHGDYLKSDIVQMAHHGHVGVRKDVYEAIDPEVCIWCAASWLWQEHEGVRYLNGEHSTTVTRQWMAEIGNQMHIVTKDGDAVIDI